MLSRVAVLSDVLGSEHILLGVLRDKGPGAKTLIELGVTRDRAEEAIKSLLLNR